MGSPCPPHEWIYIGSYIYIYYVDSKLHITPYPIKQKQCNFKKEQKTVHKKRVQKKEYRENDIAEKTSIDKNVV